MSSKLRLIALGALLIIGISLVITVSRLKTDTPLPVSLAPAFELLGTPIKSLDHLVTRVIPIDDLDERELGLVLRARYDSQVDDHDPDLSYLNEIIGHLSKDATKPFDYKVYRLQRSEPNAMALPGGVILVTSGLLNILKSESELAGILAHELGHIEMGHCLDAVKFKLLADKLGARSFGEITDFAVRLFLSHSFSKTQEDAADEYAFNRLVNSPYDPYGVGRAFGSFLKYNAKGRKNLRKRDKLNPLRDYFRSHPPMELREAKFDAKAKKWWRLNKEEVRHIGAKNLKTRTTVYKHIPDET